MPTSQYTYYSSNDGTYSLSESANIQQEEVEKIIFTFTACSPEEASAVLNIRLGHAPYKPMGEPSKCPNNCGAYYYPVGSGICPICGLVNIPRKLSSLDCFNQFVENCSLISETESPNETIEALGNMELCFTDQEAQEDQSQIIYAVLQSITKS
jgi:hypothetical protein